MTPAVWRVWGEQVRTYNVNTFPFVALTVLDGREEVIGPGCWFVGVDDLTRSLYVIRKKLSSPPTPSLVTINSRMATFWYPAYPGCSGKWPINQCCCCCCGCVLCARVLIC